MADPDRLLALYRSASGPTRAAEQRMLSALHAHVAEATLTGAGSTTSSATAGGLASKLVLALVVTSALVGVGVRARSGEPELDADASAERIEVALEQALALVHDERASVPALEQAFVPEPAPGQAPRLEQAPLPEQAPALERAAAVEQAPPRRPRARTRSSVPTHKVASTSTLADEAKLLLEADLALRRAALGEARELLEEHQRRFATSTLAREAELLGALLDCSEGKPGAVEAAHRLLDAQPDLPAKQRIEATCEPG